MSSAKPRDVPRLASLIDLAGMAFLVVGGGLYLRAYMGMSALRANDGGVTSKARFAGLTEYDRLYQLSRLGLWVAAIAVPILIAGAVMTWRARRATQSVEPSAEVVAL